MHINKIVAISVFALIATACGSQYNKFKKDVNGGSTYVYGEIDGPAKQLKNTYPSARPETVEKANKFRALVEKELVSGYAAN